MVAKALFAGITIAMLCMPMAGANANNDTKPAALPSVDHLTWQKLTDEQRDDLIKRYQDLRQMPEAERLDLQQRMDWFSQLPKDKQQRMREVWQNMSASEREHWKAKLRQVSPTQRETLREKIMQKYDKNSF
jgi:thioesterase domain-containing protein